MLKQSLKMPIHHCEFQGMLKRVTQLKAGDASMRIISSAISTGQPEDLSITNSNMTQQPTNTMFRLTVMDKSCSDPEIEQMTC